MKTKTILQFENVTFHYDKIILQQFYCSFTEKGIYCILGKSGCGKTTFLKLISGLLIPQYGTITHNAKKISFLFQENRLLPWLTILDNILTVNKDKEYCLHILEQLDLFDIEKKSPHELSGGMLRRVALAKALAYNGDIFLLDEPFTGIDIERKQKIIPFLQKKLLDKICIVITHNIEEANVFSSHLYELQKHGLTKIKK